MEYLVGDNVYPIWIDSRSKDDGPMIDWQFKIMDYVYDMLESYCDTITRGYFLAKKIK